MRAGEAYGEPLCRTSVQNMLLNRTTLGQNLY
jgi:hypothetical protein